jgi:hypothetical protein
MPVVMSHHGILPSEHMSFPEEKRRSGKDLNVSHRHIWVKRKLVPPCAIPLPFAADGGSLKQWRTP